VAKRHDPNRSEVGLAGLVFGPNESCVLHTCHWRPRDKESEETRAVQPKEVAGQPTKCPPWCQFLPRCWPPAPINSPLLHSVKGRTKSAKAASTSASTSRFCRIDRGAWFGGHPGLLEPHCRLSVEALSEFLRFRLSSSDLVHPSAEALLQFYEFHQRVSSWFPLVWLVSWPVGVALHLALDLDNLPIIVCYLIACLLFSCAFTYCVVELVIVL
jgi:hypothetical protein